MLVQGKIIRCLPSETGQSKNGKQWNKSSYLLEYGEGRYKQQMCFSLFNERATENVLCVGDEVELDFEVTSNEYNGKWYHNINGYTVKVISRVQAVGSQAVAQPPLGGYATVPPTATPPPPQPSDLPF